MPLVLAALLLPAFAILLSGSALPCTHDNIFHQYRIVAMRSMLQHGWLFSRWVPNLALGYGYPFFTYREPLPYLVGEVLFALGVPLPLALGSLYAVSLFFGAWGAFVLAQDLFGPRAAWVSAVAYGLAPYVLMDAMRRGNMPENVGLALLPWLFVVLRRLILKGGRARFLASVLLLGALFLSHNISSLLLAPFLGLYVVLLSVVHRERDYWPYAFVAVGLAVMVTAWFWLPALTEQDFVQLHLSRTTRNNDFHYNFVSWREMLLLGPTPHDSSYLNPPMRVRLGLGQTVLGAMGAVLGLARIKTRERRYLVGLFAIAGLGYLWMATSGAVGLWESFPLLAFVQFPWRLVGRALLPASLLAGVAVKVLLDMMFHRGTPSDASLNPRAPRSAWVPGVLGACVMAGFVIMSWPEVLPPRGICETARYPGLESLYARELEGWMGMDPESSYFPIWVERHPTDTSLAEAFKRGELPERFDVTSLPENGQVLTADYGPLQAELTIRSPEAFRARWLGLYYPGWRVWVDGVEVGIEPEDDTGLIRFDLPAGEHAVAVRFGLTPMRRIGGALAVLGLLGLGVCLGMPGGLVGTSIHRGRAWDGADDYAFVWSVVVATILLLSAWWGIVVRIETPIARSRLTGGDFPEVDTKVLQRYAGGLTLLGYEIDQKQLPSDGELEVALLWQAETVPDRDLRTSVLLRGANGLMWSPDGTARPRGYDPPPPTYEWTPGAYAYDPHIVIPEDGAPPGTYEVVVALFDVKTLQMVSLLDGEGRSIGTDLVVGQVVLTAPESQPDRRALGVPDAASATVCDPLALAHVSLDREVGVPGDLLAIRWVWEAVATPDADHIPVLHLLSPGGDVVQTWWLAAAADWWPTNRWTAGERWLGQHVVRLPGGLESGEHLLRVELPGCDEPLATLEFRVVAPERAFNMPAELIPADVVFEDQIGLAGYGVTPATPRRGDRIELKLAWQAVVPMETAYRIFVHLVHQDGVVVAQDDGIPARWTRPTTGWAAGEIVVDVRDVRIPDDADAGTYAVRVGIYDPEGPRLLTSMGTDGYVIQTFSLD